MVALITILCWVALGKPHLC